jgi:hypothetical protein
MSEDLRLQLDPDDPAPDATVEMAKRVYGEGLEIVEAQPGVSGKMFKRDGKDADGKDIWVECQPPHPGEL